MHVMTLVHISTHMHVSEPRTRHQVLARSSRTMVQSTMYIRSVGCSVGRAARLRPRFRLRLWLGARWRRRQRPRQAECAVEARAAPCVSLASSTAFGTPHARASARCPGPRPIQLAERPLDAGRRVRELARQCLGFLRVQPRARQTSSASGCAATPPPPPPPPPPLLLGVLVRLIGRVRRCCLRAAVTTAAAGACAPFLVLRLRILVQPRRRRRHCRRRRPAGWRRRGRRGAERLASARAQVLLVDAIHGRQARVADQRLQLTDAHQREVGQRRRGGGRRRLLLLARRRVIDQVRAAVALAAAVAPRAPPSRLRTWPELLAALEGGAGRRRFPRMRGARVLRGRRCDRRGRRARGRRRGVHRRCRGSGGAAGFDDEKGGRRRVRGRTLGLRAAAAAAAAAAFAEVQAAAAVDAAPMALCASPSPAAPPPRRRRSSSSGSAACPDGTKPIASSARSTGAPAATPARSAWAPGTTRVTPLVARRHRLLPHTGSRAACTGCGRCRHTRGSPLPQRPPTFQGRRRCAPSRRRPAPPVAGRGRHRPRAGAAPQGRPEPTAAQATHTTAATTAADAPPRRRWAVADVPWRRADRRHGARAAATRRRRVRGPRLSAVGGRFGPPVLPQWMSRTAAPPPPLNRPSPTPPWKPGASLPPRPSAVGRLRGGAGRRARWRRSPAALPALVRCASPSTAAATPPASGPLHWTGT